MTVQRRGVSETFSAARLAKRDRKSMPEELIPTVAQQIDRFRARVVRQ